MLPDKVRIKMTRYLKEMDMKINGATMWRLALVWGFVTAILLNISPAKSQNVNSARILVRSAAKIEIRTEIYAPVAEIFFWEGEKFSQGEVLIKFDCSRYEAEKNAANANMNAAGIEHRTKQKLLKYKAVGKDEVSLAGANMERANAELKVHELRIAQCEFKAPFDGRIVTRYVNAFEYPSKDKPLLTILNDTRLELQLVVPSLWLRWLKNRQQFRFELDETGKSYTGEIIRLGAEVDPVSQTIVITGRFVGRHEHILAGMSGTAFFDPGS